MEYNDLEGHWDVSTPLTAYHHSGLEEVHAIESGIQEFLASADDLGYSCLAGCIRKDMDTASPVWPTTPVAPLQPQPPRNPTENVPPGGTLVDTASELTAVTDPAGTVEAPPPQENPCAQTSQPAEVKLGWPKPKYAPSARVYCLACRRSLKYKTTLIRLHVETNMHIEYAGKYALLRRTGACEAPYPGDLVLGPSLGRLIVQVKSDEPYIWWVAEGK